MIIVDFMSGLQYNISKFLRKGSRIMNSGFNRQGYIC